MQFDTTIMPLQFNLAISEDDGHLEFVIVTGTIMPTGNGQGIPLPLGIYRLPFPTKGAVKDFMSSLGKPLKRCPRINPKAI